MTETQDFLDALGDRGIRKTKCPEGNEMFNMATMAADECREDAQERQWHRWEAQAAKILGRRIVDGSDDDMLHDLYCDGCTPTEAVTELLAQQELERAA